MDTTINFNADILPTYNVTIPDIQHYLAALTEDEEVGEPNNMDSCLVARTLQWKYPNDVAYVREYNQGARVAEEFVPFTDEVYQIAEKFDDLYYGSITKAELREKMPELFGEVTA